MIDRYTKAVLTVIACALVVLAAQGFIEPVTAQGRDNIQRVQICDVQGCASLLPRMRKDGKAILGWSLAVDSGN